MNYSAIEHKVTGSREFMSSSLAQRGIWLGLMQFCTQQENCGVIKNFREWSRLEVKRTLGVPQGSILKGCRLWWMVGDDLVVFGYPQEKQVSLEAKRRNLQANCARGDRPRFVPADKVPDVLPDAPLEVRSDGAGDMAPAMAVYVPHEKLPVAQIEDCSSPAPLMDEVVALIGPMPSLMVDPEAVAEWMAKRDRFVESRTGVRPGAVVAAPRVPECVAAGDVKTMAYEVFRECAGGDDESLIRCLNMIESSWADVPRVEGLERRSFVTARTKLADLSAEDWQMLWRYYRKFAGENKRGCWAPVTRSQFLAHCGDVLQQAFRWGRARR